MMKIQFKRSTFLTYTLSVIMLTGMAACSLKLNPETSCNFVMNSMQQRVSWNANVPVNLYIHESLPTEFVPALNSAIKKWEDSLGKKLFEVVGVIGGPLSPSKDGVSVIYYMDTWEADKTTEQARTTIYWQGEQIVEGDMRINAKNFTYFFSDTPVTASVDIESLFIHELGHLIGLAHDEASGSVMNARLASGFLRRDIGSIDISSAKCEY